ncbi:MULTISPECIES: TM2 domain-containing protein [Aestuariibaculum]|uniref:TM2 domain-containing protein n=1 Tax=Aestuariibaculum lutulentum TaxID=2920935 RepID=A0ABS9RHD2_9FLAO|nr:MULTISPECIES: TM2 domain-containing protein [Aestuariibaculum]MCH4552344.1 TM2 domain-containing protein [Aestuariibaculum lutulentum]MCR8667447.1 TM2 domain-containing protein [Aestuariibaculum sp. M13]
MSEDKNLNDDLKDKAKEFADGAKETAKEFTEGAKEAYSSFENPAENKKILAGILAILVGYLGIHKFVLGYTKEGIIQLIASVVTCGIASIIPIIEGIIYLTKTDADFYNTYQVGKKPWF